MKLFNNINIGRILYDGVRSYFGTTNGGALTNTYKYLLAILYPLQLSFDSYNNKRRRQFLLAQCKWQKGQLEGVLNAIYDPIQKRIQLSSSSLSYYFASPFNNTARMWSTWYNGFDFTTNAYGYWSFENIQNGVNYVYDNLGVNKLYLTDGLGVQKNVAPSNGGTGKYNQGFSNGSNPGILKTHLTTPSISEKFSISAWFYLSPSTSNVDYISLMNKTTGLEVKLSCSNASGSFKIRYNGIDIITPVIDASWFHAVVNYNGQLFINGVEYSAAFGADFSALQLDVNLLGGTKKVDEVLITKNRIFTLSEAQSLYNSGDGLFNDTNNGVMLPTITTNIIVDNTLRIYVPSTIYYNSLLLKEFESTIQLLIIEGLTYQILPR